MEEGNTKSKFRRVCVFCGSNSGHRKVFSDAALELGNELVCLFFFCYSLPLLKVGVESQALGLLYLYLYVFRTCYFLMILYSSLGSEYWVLDILNWDWCMFSKCVLSY